MDDNKPEDICDPQSPMGVDDAPGSPEPEEEPMEVNSPISEGGSDYEDAPSRFEESKLEDSSVTSPSACEIESQKDRAATKDDETSEKLSELDTTGSPNLSKVINPGIADETIYASASESFSEIDNRGVSLKEDDSRSEGVSEDNADDTNDPLGLDDDSNNDGVDEIEEGEAEEGELNRDDESKDQKSAAYQTEPVSSDEDLDAVQDNSSLNKSAVDTATDLHQNDEISSKNSGYQVTRNVQNGHTGPDNDINHEDHVELDYEEDLDEGDKLRGDSKIEEDGKVKKNYSYTKVGKLISCQFLVLASLYFNFPGLFLHCNCFVIIVMQL